MYIAKQYAHVSVRLSHQSNISCMYRISTEYEVFPYKKDLGTSCTKHRERSRALRALGVSCSSCPGLSYTERPMYEVDIRLTHRALGRLSRKEYMSNSIRCKMSGYDSDDILSQALDLFEEQEAAKIFLTQNTFR